MEFRSDHCLTLPLKKAVSHCPSYTKLCQTKISQSETQFDKVLPCCSSWGTFMTYWVMLCWREVLKSMTLWNLRITSYSFDSDHTKMLRSIDPIYPPFLSSFIYLVVFSPFLVIMVNPDVTDIHSSESNFQMQWQRAAFILVIFLEEVLGLFEGAGTGRMSRLSITCSPIRTPDRCHHRRHYRQYSHHCRWCD